MFPLQINIFLSYIRILIFTTSKAKLEIDCLMSISEMGRFIGRCPHLCTKFVLVFNIYHADVIEYLNPNIFNMSFKWKTTPVSCTRTSCKDYHLWCMCLCVRMCVMYKILKHCMYFGATVHILYYVQKYVWLFNHFSFV